MHVTYIYIFSFVCRLCVQYSCLKAAQMISKIYLEALYINVPKLLVANDHKFYKMMTMSLAFSDIVSQSVRLHLSVVLTQIVLAQEVIDGMP